MASHRGEVAVSERQRAMDCLDSLQIVEQVFSDSVLERVAQHAYNQYIAPKVRPFCAVSTVSTIKS